MSKNLGLDLISSLRSSTNNSGMPTCPLRNCHQQLKPHLNISQTDQDMPIFVQISQSQFFSHLPTLKSFRRPSRNTKHFDYENCQRYSQLKFRDLVNVTSFYVKAWTLFWHFVRLQSRTTSTPKIRFHFVTHTRAHTHHPITVALAVTPKIPIGVQCSLQERIFRWIKNLQAGHIEYHSSRSPFHTTRDKKR